MTKTLAMPQERLNRVSLQITATLFTTQSLISAATISAFTVSSIIAVTLSGTDSAAGIPSTATNLGRALMAYPIGWIFDKYGRRQGLSLAFLLGVLGALVSVLAVIWGSFWVFLFGALLLGAMRSGSEQARFVAAEVSRVTNRAKVIGVVVFAGTVGSVFGPSLVDPSTRLSLWLNLPENTGPFLVAALLLFASLVLIFSTLRPDPLRLGRLVAELDGEIDAEGGSSSVVSKPVRSIAEIYSGSVVRLAVLSMTIGQLVMAMLMVITPVHMSHHNHSLINISSVIMAHTMGMFGLSWLTGWLIDRFGRYTIIATGATILVVSAIIAPISPNLIPLATALFLLGLGWNFCFVAGSSLLSDNLLSHERGRAQGTSEMLVAVGASAGSLLSGILFNLGSMLTVSLVGLTLSALLLGATIWVVSRR